MSNIEQGMSKEEVEGMFVRKTSSLDIPCWTFVIQFPQCSPWFL